jgi:hypothetical protein
MRAIIVVIIALGGMALSSGHADAGAWCNFTMGQRKLRLFLLRSVLGHRARHRRILPT